MTAHFQICATFGGFTTGSCFEPVHILTLQLMLGLYSCRSYRIPKNVDPKFLWYWIYNWQFVIEAFFSISFFVFCYNFLVILRLCLPVMARICGSDGQNARRNAKLITEFHLGDERSQQADYEVRLPDIGCESVKCHRLSAAKEMH